VDHAGENRWIMLVRNDSTRILLLYDMEGVSTVDRNSMTLCRNKDDYVRAQAGLEADVNAVIEGLVRGGAKSIEVVDGHGSGCEEDLPCSRLDRRAQYLDTKNDTTPFWQRPWDAAVFVGMHAGSGSGGFLPHTTVYGFTRLVNGRPISESEQIAYQLGEYGIPVIFDSGDDVLAASIRQSLPWVEYVQVKRTLSVGFSATRRASRGCPNSAHRRRARDAES
jgi:D-amino peptidase